MKIYNESKTQLLQEYDLKKGYLKDDTIVIHYNEIQEVKEQGHYQTIKEYPNGGKDVSWIIDIPRVEYQPARDEIEKIKVYIPYTAEQLNSLKIQELRQKREIECFSIINRGKLWYKSLNIEQLNSLNDWYKKWLDVTITLIVPTKPTWIR